jgi:flagellar biosynthesis protein FlhB
MLGVLIRVLVHQRVSRETAIILLLATGLVFVVPDILRQYSSKMNDLFVSLFQSVIRQGEVHRLSGNSYLITGVLTVVLFFPPVIVGLSLLRIPSPVALAFSTAKIKLLVIKVCRVFWPLFSSVQWLQAAIFMFTIY